MGYAIPTFEEEFLARKYGYKTIAGVDEVGRGPIAGPVVSGALVFDIGLDLKWVYDIRDSKQLSDKQRRRIVDGMDQEGVNRGLGIVSASEIDKIGIVAATKLSMVQAVGKLKGRPDFLLIDAVDLEETGIDYKSIIKGDQTCASIAAASVMAKVTRDKIMLEEDKKYPQYHFAKHKGYPTKNHMEQLKRFGPSPIHRRSFAPVKLHINYDLTET